MQKTNQLIYKTFLIWTMKLLVNRRFFKLKLFQYFFFIIILVHFQLAKEDIYIMWQAIPMLK